MHSLQCSALRLTGTGSIIAGIGIGPRKYLITHTTHFGFRKENPFSLSIPSTKPPKTFNHVQKRVIKADLSQDAPFAIAIGACILSSIAFPLLEDVNADKDLDASLLGADEARYGAMTIISLIPLFNWMAWVFAWLDTKQQRYLLYSLVYIAPYIKSGFSLSPDESWLPISSLIACIIHVQLENSLSTEGEEPRTGLSKFISSNIRTKELKEQANQIFAKLLKLDIKKELSISEKEAPEDSRLDQEYFHQELLEFDEKLARLEEEERRSKISAEAKKLAEKEEAEKMQD